MPAAFTLDQLRDHWLGHRRLTRRTIEAFPDDDAFATFSVGGMRPFSHLAYEISKVGAPTLRGLVTGDYGDAPTGTADAPPTRAVALARHDADTAEIEALWPRLTEAKMQETATAFGRYTMPAWALLMYVIDNEIHHRAQGFVYLRALGVAPPAFPDRR